MPNELTTKKQCKDLSIGDFIGHLVTNKIDIGISFSIDESGLRIKIDNPLVLEIVNEFELTIGGETNVVSKGINIDTLFDKYGTVWNLNGRNSKQIRDEQTSIEFRNKVVESKEKLEELTKGISAPSITADSTEKTEFLKQYELKDITKKEV
jgi:hypothetical protein